MTEVIRWALVFLDVLLINTQHLQRAQRRTPPSVYNLFSVYNIFFLI